MLQLPHSLKSFLTRLFVFLVLFLIFSGVMGSWVVSTRLLYGFHFFIYGNIGKMVILGSVVFLLLTRKKLQSIEMKPYPKRNILFLLASFVLLPFFFWSGSELLKFSNPTDNLFLFILTHILLILIPLLAFVGSFGMKTVIYLTQIFKKELWICILLGTILYFAIFQVWKLWPYLSSIVLQSVKFLFSLTFDQVKVFPPLTLKVQDFAVRIEQACSGLDSLFMFSVLYWVIGMIDWKTMNKKKLFLLYPLALAGLFLVNILRVYLIILIGVVYSPELSLKLFHTYAGMILFIIYFGLFMKVTYTWMKR